MFKSYLLTAIRNMLRHKSFSAIIIVGLTIGIAIFGLVFAYVQNELTYDRFNLHYSSIYRLESPDWALTGTAYAPELAMQFPEILSSARISCWEGNEVTVKAGEKMMTLNHVIYADSAVFNIFTFKFLKSSPQRCFESVQSIVLTESTARRIFGDEDPMNKTVRINNMLNFTVTGVIADVSRFHIPINGLANFLSLAKTNPDPSFLNHYDTWNYYTYLRLKDGSDFRQLESKINRFYSGRALWVDRAPDFFLRPLSEVYYTPVKNDMSSQKGSKAMLLIYLITAIFILCIACVNFINLSIAQSASRSREIGVRKSAGARRFDLIGQFTGEAILYAFLATELSLVLMELLRPFFNSLVQRDITLLSLNMGWIVFLVIILPLGIGVLAGLYPALHLSRFNAIMTMKSEKTRGRGSLGFRRMLIVLQFTISIMLIMGTFVVYKQLSLIRNANLGYNKENILQLTMNAELDKNIMPFRELLMRNPSVKGVSLSTQTIASIGWQEGIDVDGTNKPFTYLGVDTGYLSLMEIKILEGRGFQALSGDSNKAILNEAAVSYFNLKSPVVGQYIGTGTYRIEILGVVKDFHFHSLRDPIGPLVIGLRKNWLSTVNIKISGENITSTLRHIETVWDKICPEIVFNYRFLDDQYQQLYEGEMRLGKTFIFLAMLAIFIACIGLYGLSSLLAGQRIKEIGVRKVLGDTSNGIAWIFGREFTNWILISALIAIPVSWFVMNKWLHTFAYHVQIDAFILVASFVIAWVVALVTIYLQILKYAVKNPVEALRYE
jgi:putative ABC transport system permease protein